ncbi:hypothetical protein [Nostoc sp.]|uniref:hypothetical protein n=1 Tax=Nostoc sp. TaxID=1180 RepID=UPI002FEF440B
MVLKLDNYLKFALPSNHKCLYNGKYSIEYERQVVFAKAMMALCDRNILAKSDTLGKIVRSLNIKISATPSQ